MTVAHIVLFKFKPDVSDSQKRTTINELKTLKSLPSVLNQRLIVGGPSITEPIESSQGFHFALLSFHPDPAALAEYQASEEHYKVASQYIWPFKEDVIRFDFEVHGAEDVYTSIASAALGK